MQQWTAGLPSFGGDCLRLMHLEQSAVIVGNYGEAIQFFVERFGFELLEDSPALTNDGRPKRWVVVRPPGATAYERMRHHGVEFVT